MRLCVNVPVLARLAVVFMSVLLAGNRPVAAAASESDLARLNQAVTVNHTLPRYEFMANATGRLKSSAREFCRIPDRGSLRLLRDSFHETLDTWSEVNHIHFGRIMADKRYMRLFAWPDDKQLVGRSLDKRIKALLADKTPTKAGSRIDAGAFEPEIQGFPALGRLLFGADSERLLKGDAMARVRCRLVVAIAANIARIAQQNIAEWREGPQAFAKLIETAGEPGNTRFPTVGSATKKYLDSLQESLRIIADEKLPRIVKAESNMDEVRKLECVYSNRPLRNVMINLRAIYGLYRGEDGFGFDDILLMDTGSGAGGLLYNRIQKAFVEAIRTASNLVETGVPMAGDAQMALKIDDLRQKVAALAAMFDEY
ncbi:MAG TPA: hypothetical protein ENK41_03820, partial [Rhodobacteraceae bacterium]|nr:hypothetical protein [Paracoccaceae bacterium]